MISIKLMIRQLSKKGPLRISINRFHSYFSCVICSSNFSIKKLKQCSSGNGKERKKVLDYWSNKMAPPRSSRLYEKLSKKNPDGTIDNLSNTLNPAFYRGIHLEVARRLTPISQGGYLPLNQGNVPEDEICQQEKIEEPTEKSSLRYHTSHIHKEFHLHLWELRRLFT